MSQFTPKRAAVAPKPLVAARLNELALAYVARFATSAARLEAYLLRKLQAAGWAEGAGDEEGALGEAAMAAGRAAVAGLVARFVAAGYVDDAGYARMKAGALQRRGLGARRIDQALGAAGIDAAIREAVRPGEAAARAAALGFARRRGLGPFARRPEAAGDPALRQKQLAAMLRAGHAMGHARAVLACADAAEAEAWAADAAEDTPQDDDDGFWDA